MNEIDTIRERLTTSWTGSKANEVVVCEPPFEKVPYSELAMHVKIAGKDIRAYALFKNERGDWINWAQVLTDGDTITDGLPAEVLPEEIKNKHKLT